jgi:hypothetical protein
VHQFLVVLSGTNPLVWRRIQVPEKYSFWVTAGRIACSQDLAIGRNLVPSASDNGTVLLRNRFEHTRPDPARHQHIPVPGVALGSIGTHGLRAAFFAAVFVVDEGSPALPRLTRSFACFLYCSRLGRSESCFVAISTSLLIRKPSRILSAVNPLRKSDLYVICCNPA